LFRAFEEQWLLILRDALVHHGAVPVSLNVGLDPLEGFTPRWFAYLVAGQAPGAEASEVLEEALSNFVRREVDECIAKT